MAIRKMTVKQWQKAVAAAHGKPSWLNYQGDSPGGVAAKLDISRQAVHKAVRRGDLDALIINDDVTGRLRMFLIPEPSVEAFKMLREAKRAG